MFLEEIDWSNPRYSKWNLQRLGRLNKAQLDAFFDDDDIDNPPFTETELKEMALKFPCRVELFHSNVCHGVERSWPKKLFRRQTYRELLPRQKKILVYTMVKKAVKLYKIYVSDERRRNRLIMQRDRALAPYLEERFLRNRFLRIKALGVVKKSASSESDCSVVTVIDTSQGEKDKRRTKNRRKPRDEIERQLRRIVHDISSDEESSVSLLDEVSNETRQHESNQPEMSIEEMFNDDHPGLIKINEVAGQHLISVVQQEYPTLINISDDSISSNEGLLIIDDRFTDFVSETIEIETETTTTTTTYTQRSSDFVECVTPHFDPSELVPINVDLTRPFRSGFDESWVFPISPNSPIFSVQSANRR